MSTAKSTRAPKIDPALRIPLTVLAAIPEKLRTLGETMKVAAAASDAEFRKPHNAVREAYDDANGSSNNAVNAFGVLQYLVTNKHLTAVVDAARDAQALTSAIYKSSGNIHNDDCFKRTFRDVATLEATLAALRDCGDKIRAAVKVFGY